MSVLSSRGVPTSLFASDETAATVEDLQFTLGEGPSLDASASRGPVLVSDLFDPAEGVGERWPVFLTEVRRIGVRAVFAFPVRFGAIAFGTLGLYRRAPGPLTDQQLARGLRAADALAGCLMVLEGPADADSSYPMTVHQAAGMVMVQLGVSIEEAMVRLRATAFVEGVPVASVADAIVRRRRTLADEEER